MTPERKKRIEDVLDRRQPDVAVVLENVADPHNVSAVMRSCDAVGVQDIYILNTKIPKHEYYGIQSSASSKKWVSTYEYDDLDKCISDLKYRGFKILTSHLGSQSQSLYDMDFTVPVALVFGNEREGISDDLLAYSEGNFVIPQVGMVRSLNISVACAVTLYEMLRQREIEGMYDRRSLDSKRRRELIEVWEENKKEPRRRKSKKKP